MSNHKYVPNPNYLFEDSDMENITPVDGFRTRIPPPQLVNGPYKSQKAELDHQQHRLQRKQEIQQRTIDSCERSIHLLEDSKIRGIHTARELTRQREQLENTSKSLDDININLNYSQKHLNGIKSVFYGLKNNILGKSDQALSKIQTSPSTSHADSSSSKFTNTLDYRPQMTSEQRYQTHPLTQLQDQQQMNTPITDSQQEYEMVDRKLDDKAYFISSLKDLGIALGEEIEQQNVLIDTIQDKVEHANIKIVKQNKQMNNFLGK